MDGPPLQAGPPPMDVAADHPDLYIPEPVRHFLPFFKQQVADKVGSKPHVDIVLLLIASGIVYMYLYVLIVWFL